MRYAYVVDRAIKDDIVASGGYVVSAFIDVNQNNIWVLNIMGSTINFSEEPYSSKCKLSDSCALLFKS